MKRVLGFVAAATVAIAIPFVVLAATGIRNSRHDLSSTSGTAGPKSTSNGQICIFCHTPHKAQSTILLWNHTMTSATLTWDTPTTSKGTTIPSALNIGSKRCLSCHDGSTAIGDVSNAGAGAAGVIAVTSTTGSQVDGTGKLIDTSFLVGSGGNMTGTHPVGIAYPGSAGAYYGSTTGIATPASDGYYPSQTGAGCAIPGLYCTTAAAGDGVDGSKVKLYRDTTNGGVGVECGSCHDTHNEYGNAHLTVIENENASGLCRSCHNK
jgi:predicted CXXCH cytochrome family protein